MPEWKSYKGNSSLIPPIIPGQFSIAPVNWDVIVEQKSSYNEGDHISDFTNPIWSMEQGNDVPITPNHNPCGYWTKGYSGYSDCNGEGMLWDDPNSADTIVRGGSCTVAIIDTTGFGKPYYWQVTGTGFTIDASITNGLTNVVRADATACGSATITVVGCDGTIVTGYVRCTSGQWVLATNCTIAAGGCACSATSGNTLTLWWLRIGPTCPGGATCGAATVCIACIGSINPVNCKQLTYTWECL